MAQPSFEIDTPMAYHITQRNILLRVEAGADPEHLRRQWKDTIDRIVDTYLGEGDALDFVAAPEHASTR